MASIHEAARAGDLVALLSFLNADALSLNARDQHSRTPLHLASWAGHADVVHTLCKKHADVGAAAADNMAAIHFASQKGHTQVVRYLLAAGASVTACTRKGMTPLHYAIQGGHLDMTKLLIRKGANLNTQNKAGKKAIDLAKNDEFRSELLVAERETQEAKAADKKSKSKVVIESAIAPELVASEEKDEDSTERVVAIEEKDGQTEDSTEKVDASPPRKKNKVQLSNLGMDKKSDEVGRH